YDYLAATALALRGWAGMVRQIEERPDRVPTHPVPATLAEFMAIRLLLERAALEHACATNPLLAGPVSELRQRLPAPSAAQTSESERAWPLFHVAQLCGLDAAALSNLPASQLGVLAAELSEFDELSRRRVLHLAYERRFRHRIYD